ncbi:MAG: PilZ domain-containing protein [Acidobacteriia bacterium]|nr:PilZ domain-containing protein [Terriglobia bacterium]
MPDETNNGVAYLQALKQAGNLTSGATSTAQGSMPADPVHAGSDGGAHHSGPEKRRSPRYKCEGSIEMKEDGSDVRTWATFTDISMHGCYVEAAATYPKGTNLMLKLAASGFQVSAKGTVRVNYPYLGMGIAFTEMSQDDRARLRSLLQTVARPSVIMGPGVAASESPMGAHDSVPLTSDPAAAVQALVHFFEDRHMLLRDEFLRILQSSQAGGKLSDR